MENLITQIALATFSQIVGIFGIFFVCGFILSQIQTWTARTYARAVGWRGILWTAWIGTPIHELGHAFVARLFRHRVNKISLFQPNQSTGNLGSVDHSFNPKSLYQRMGNFFIGAAPLFFGTAVLTLLLITLVPNGKEIIRPLTDGTSFTTLWTNVIRTFRLLFSSENIHEWSFWLFLYISFCIASHVAPSKEDRKSMWGGFFWIVLLFFLLNAIALGFQKPGLTAWLEHLTRYLGIFFGMFLYTIILSLFHFVLASILLFPLRKY